MPPLAFGLRRTDVQGCRMVKPLRLTRRLTLDMPAAAFFQAATMTDRVERVTGLPPARFTMSREPGGRQALRADARFLGVPVHWYELPFEWVDGRYWVVHRLFEGLPIQTIDVTTRIQPVAAERTAVDILVEVLPRNWLGRIGAVFVFGFYTLTLLTRLYRSFAARYAMRVPDLFPTPLKPVVHHAALTSRMRDLQTARVAGDGILRLYNHLLHAPDDAVSDMRPFALADSWRLDRMETLRVFLYATHAGLLDLHWNVLCPNCRVAQTQPTALADLGSTAHCDTCNIRYDVNFDEYVELRFTVSTAVREVYSATFCIGGPYQTRHIVAQIDLLPGASVAVPLAGFAPGSYRWRTRQRTERGTVELSAAGTVSQATYRFTPDTVQLPAVHTFGPAATLCFENAGPAALLLIVEQAAWGTDGVSAALVTSLQEFRHLFAAQVLAPGVSVAVRSLTVLFSDLKDSTALYEQVGDAAAYVRVRDHVAILQAVITAHRGALVKTIGDAVMAVFSVTADAVAAGLAIQTQIAAYNADAAHDALCVKLGLHCGPCIAINANGVLDYFGSTVNIAARVQSISAGDDLIFTAAVADDPGVITLLAGHSPDSFNTTLKGLAQVFTLYRVITAAG